MHTISVTTEQLAHIVAALHSVAPSGGGSTPFHLANLLSTYVPSNAEPAFAEQTDKLTRLGNRTVIEGYIECIGSRDDDHLAAAELIAADLRTW